MGRSRYKIQPDQQVYFISSSLIKGVFLFQDPKLAEIMIASFRYLGDQSDVSLYAYVLMENHFHLILKTDRLVDHIRNLKGFTANRIIRYLEEHGKQFYLQRMKFARKKYRSELNYQVWQEGYHPKSILSHNMMCQKIDYIHQNPVNRGYIAKPKHWLYSSAADYEGGSGLVPVEVYVV